MFCAREKDFPKWHTTYVFPAGKISDSKYSFMLIKHFPVYKESSHTFFLLELHNIWKSCDYLSYINWNGVKLQPRLSHTKSFVPSTESHHAKLAIHCLNIWWRIMLPVGKMNRKKDKMNRKKSVRNGQVRTPKEELWQKRKGLRDKT